MKNFNGMFTDINKNIIYIDDNVIVPEPNESDLHNFSFVGNVIDILENGNVIVEDGDFDCFEIESDRLEVVY